MRVVVVVALLAAAVAAAAPRPSRRECLRSCGVAMAVCREASGRPRFCRRRVVKLCRHLGKDYCLTVTTTTEPLLPSTTTTTVIESTTTTLEIDRTVNGCNRGRATDRRGSSAVTVQTEGFDYAPECIRVSPGTSVSIHSSFGTFRLVGGEDGRPDRSSPFGRVTSGSQATFTISQPGVYGYYSDPWWIVGMHGAVIVEP